MQTLGEREQVVRPRTVVLVVAAVLMLTGPGVRLHAVILARLRYGEGWQRAGWLAALAPP